MSYTFCVLKVGGSLLTLADLSLGLNQWADFLSGRLADSDAPSRTQLVVLVGGGAMVDVVRDWDKIHGLPAVSSHRLALRAMRLTAGLVADLTGWPLVILPGRAALSEGSVYSAIISGAAVDRPVIAEISTLAEECPTLPISWDVTSDSLGIWLAGQLQAERLVLLKRVNPLEDMGQLSKIGDLGWIDSCFSRMWSEVARPELQVDIAHYFERPFRFTPVTLNSVTASP